MRLRVHPEEGDIHQEAGRQSIISSTSWLTGKKPWSGRDPHVTVWMRMTLSRQLNGWERMRFGDYQGDRTVWYELKGFGRRPESAREVESGRIMDYRKRGKNASGWVTRELFSTELWKARRVEHSRQGYWHTELSLLSGNRLSKRRCYCIFFWQIGYNSFPDGGWGHASKADTEREAERRKGHPAVSFFGVTAGLVLQMCPQHQTPVPQAWRLLSKSKSPQVPQGHLNRLWDVKPSHRVGSALMWHKHSPCTKLNQSDQNL